MRPRTPAKPPGGGPAEVAVSPPVTPTTDCFVGGNDVRAGSSAHHIGSGDTLPQRRPDVPAALWGAMTFGPVHPLITSAPVIRCHNGVPMCRLLSNSRLPTTLNARDQPPAEVSDQRVSGLTGAVQRQPPWLLLEPMRTSTATPLWPPTKWVANSVRRPSYCPPPVGSTPHDSLGPGPTGIGAVRRPLSAASYCPPPVGSTPHDSLGPGPTGIGAVRRPLSAASPPSVPISVH